MIAVITRAAISSREGMMKRGCSFHVSRNTGAVVLHATPLRQSVQSGKADAGEEIPKTEVVELIEKGAQVYRSARYQSSYLLYKDGGKTKVVWYESDADLAEKVMLCRLLGVKTVYIEK